MQFRLSVVFPKRLFIFGTALLIVANAMTDIRATVFQNHVGFNLYHFALTIITYYLFRIDTFLYAILLQICYKLYCQTIPFNFINIVIIFFMGASEKREVLVLFERTVNDIGQDFQDILKRRIVFVLLPYAIVLAMFIPWFLYNRGIIQSGTIFMTTITIMCTTSIETTSFLTVITYIGLFFPKAMLMCFMWEKLQNQGIIALWLEIY